MALIVGSVVELDETYHALLSGVNVQNLQVGSRLFIGQAHVIVLDGSILWFVACDASTVETESKQVLENNPAFPNRSPAVLLQLYQLKCQIKNWIPLEFNVEKSIRRMANQFSCFNARYSPVDAIMRHEDYCPLYTPIHSPPSCISVAGLLDLLHNHPYFERNDTTFNVPIHLCMTLAELQMDSNWLLAKLEGRHNGRLHWVDRTGSVPTQLVHATIRPESLNALWRVSSFHLCVDHLPGSTHLRRPYLQVHLDHADCIIPSRSSPVPSNYDRLIFVQQCMSSWNDTQESLVLQIVADTFLLSRAKQRETFQTMSLEEPILAVMEWQPSVDTCDAVALRTGQWYFISGPVSVLSANGNQMYLRLTDPIRLRTVTWSAGEKTSTSLFLDLDSRSKELVERVTERWKTHHRPWSVSEVLQMPIRPKTGDSSGFLSSGYFSQLITVSGVLLAVEFRERDKEKSFSRVEHDQARTLLDRHGIGLGHPGRILFLRIRETEGIDEMGVYADITRTCYPFGLVPGKYITVRNVTLKRSKAGAVYATYLPCSSFELGDTIVQKELDLLDDDGSKLEMVPWMYLTNVKAGDRTMLRFTCSITTIEYMSMKWQCDRCSATVFNKKCPNRCHETATEPTTAAVAGVPGRLYVCATMIVSDGTREALLKVYNDVVLKFLHLDPSSMTSLQESVQQFGELVYSEPRPWESSRTEHSYQVRFIRPSFDASGCQNTSQQTIQRDCISLYAYRDRDSMPFHAYRDRDECEKHVGTVLARRSGVGNHRPVNVCGQVLRGGGGGWVDMEKGKRDEMQQVTLRSGRIRSKVCPRMILKVVWMERMRDWRNETMRLLTALEEEYL